MSLIHWKEEFSVGVAEVDHEHQELIESINQLHRSVQEGVTRKQVIEGLGDIFAQIAAHFALEEKFMRESHYRAYRDHKDDHEALNWAAQGTGTGALLLNATKVGEIQAVATAGERMPHKSTYFYPKPLTGLVINVMGTV